VAWSRHALAEALANAPSLWTLGNAGMGALQVHLKSPSTYELMYLSFCFKVLVKQTLLFSLV
jgi:hypothetical protein